MNSRALLASVCLLQLALPLSELPAQNLYWDCNAAAMGRGGNGSWSGNNWSNSAMGLAAGSAWVPGSRASLGGSAGSIDVDAGFSLSGLTFSSSGYIIYGAGSLNLSNTIALDCGFQVSAQIGVPLSGSGGLNKTGQGTLILSAENSYSGSSNVALGALALGTGIILSSENSGVAAGSSHSLILKADGGLWAQGYNLNGQLGLGDNSDRAGPTLVIAPSFASGQPAVRTMAAGGSHSLILRSDGSLWSMGDNSSGQLGLGDANNRNRPNQVWPAPAASQPSPCAIAAGSRHSLILKTDGSLWAMGSNQKGQLGFGDRVDRQSPTQVLAAPAAGQPGVTALAAGGDHSLILKADGSLWACGLNNYGQLGLGDRTDRTSFTQVLAAPASGQAGVRFIAAGAWHSLVVKSDGSLWSMGYNLCGQLALGDTTDRSRPTQVLASGVRTAAACDWHSLVLKTDGSLWAAGYNYFGELGTGDNDNRSSLAQIGASAVSAVAGGAYHSLILKSDGSLLATGSNRYGQLGLSAGDRNSPGALPTAFRAGKTGTLGNTAVSVQSGARFAYRPGPLGAATDIGSSLTINAGGILDLYVADDSDNQDPLSITGPLILNSGHAIHLQTLASPAPGTYTLLTASSISGELATPSSGGAWNYSTLTLAVAGNSLVLSVADAGILEAVVGEPFALTLGSGSWSLTSGALPVGLSLSSSNGITSLSGSPSSAPGPYAFSLTRRMSNGTVSITSYSLNLQPSLYWDVNGSTAGLGGSGLWVGNNWSASSSGTASSGLWTTGARAYFSGEAGSVTLEDVFTASSLNFLSNGFSLDGNAALNLIWPASLQCSSASTATIAVALGGSHGLSKTGAGRLVFTAANTFSGDCKVQSGALQLGSGKKNTAANCAIEAGYRQSLILREDGSLWTMGANALGQLGQGDLNARNQPTQMLAEGVRSVAVGQEFCLILKTDGSLWGAGGNEVGQLGLGDEKSRNRPTKILSAPAAGEAGIAAIAANGYHSLIVKTDGSLWAMGYNYYGQLGLGDNTNRSSPTQVLAAPAAGQAGVSAVTAGYLHNLILKTDGSLWVMGENSYGQLGLGDARNRNQPTQLYGPVGEGEARTTAIAAGMYHSLILRTDGLWGMGSDGFGQLGYESGYTRLTPYPLPYSGVAAIAAGDYHSLVLKTDGSVWGSGIEASGELGRSPDPNYPMSSTPVRVLARGARAIAAGYTHSLILKTDGSVVATGSNEDGELGLGDNTNRYALSALPSVFMAGRTGSLGNTPVSVQSGASLAYRPGPSSAASDLGASLTLNSGSTLDLSVSNATSSQDPLNVTGRLILKSGHLINLQADLPPAPGSYTLLTAASITGTAATPSFSGSWSNSNATLAVSGNSLVLTVDKLDQSISFDSIGNQSQNATLLLSATASSGLPVSFSSNSAIASLNGNRLSFTGSGSVTITASQAGDGRYLAAPAVSRSFNVTQASPVAARSLNGDSKRLVGLASAGAGMDSGKAAAQSPASKPAAPSAAAFSKGRYEALLRSPTSEANEPRLILGLLSLGSTGSSASAKLQLLSQDKPVMLAGALRQDNGEFILKSGSGEQAYRLGLICQEDNRLAVTLRRAALLLAVASDGRPLQEGLVQGSAQGRYSLRLQALGTGEGQPADPGLAMGLLQAKGRLDVAGRLGDGSSITGSLNLDAALAYRMLILPHSAAKAWLGGQWSLQAPADGNSSWGAQSDDLLWRRGPHPKDQRYPQGLGPLPLHLDMRR